MPTNQEHLFISHQIPDLNHDEVLESLGPTISGLRTYFDEREVTIQDLLNRVATGEDVDLPIEASINDMELRIEATTTPAEAIILQNGDVITGPSLEIHLMAIDDDPNDFVTDPRTQIANLARKVKDQDLATGYPFTVATTYPKLARLAHKLIGMEFAVATYFPAIEWSQDTLWGIHILANHFRKRNGLLSASNPEIESLVMPTTEFVDRFAA